MSSILLQDKTQLLEDCVCFLSKGQTRCELVYLKLTIKNVLFYSEQNVKPLYHDAECGPSVNFLVLQHEVIEISYPKTIMGWTVKDEQLSVSKGLLRLNGKRAM